MENYFGPQCDTEIILLPADVQRNLTFLLYGHANNRTIAISGPAESRIRIDLPAMPPDACGIDFMQINLFYPQKELLLNCLKSATTTYSRSNMTNIKWTIARDLFGNASSPSSYVVTLEASMCAAKQKVYGNIQIFLSFICKFLPWEFVPKPSNVPGIQQ